MSEQVNRIIQETETNLFNWFLNDTEIEILHDFPCLRNINGSGEKIYIEYLTSFPSEKQLDLAKLLSSRTRKSKNGTLTEAEAASVEEYIRFVLDSKFGLKSSGLASLPQGKDKFQISVKRLSTCIRAALTEICGEIMQPQIGNEWVHTRVFGRWTINTTVLTRSKGQQLRYSHTLILDEKTPLPILIDKMRWMGAGETEWDHLQEGDEESACQQLTDLCTHFMETVPMLLVQE